MSHAYDTTDRMASASPLAFRLLAAVARTLDRAWALAGGTDGRGRVRVSPVSEEWLREHDRRAGTQQADI
jgi:hypothetical protein